MSDRIKNLGAKRAEKSRNAADWSVVEMLDDAARRIEQDLNCKPVRGFVIWQCDDGQLHYNISGTINGFEQIGFLHAVIDEIR